MKTLSWAVLALTIGYSATGDANSMVDEFGRNLSQWRASGATDYEYEMRRICECGSGSNALVKVVVRGGFVREITYAESSEELYVHWTEEARKRARKFAVGEPVDPEFLQAYPSIHELFGIIAEALARPAALLKVEYERSLGYPLRILLDPVLIMTDGKKEYLVQNLELLNPAGTH